MASTINCTGSCLPQTRVSSSKLEQDLGLEIGWIKSRTGVEYRAIADRNDAVSDLAIRAARVSLDSFSRRDLPEIETLILATSTPDHPLPPTAPLVAYQLGLSGVGAMDLTVACCGFLYALKLADSLVQTESKSVLLIAANILSRRVRPDDIGTLALFADAAGSLVLSPGEDSGSGLIGSVWSSDGSGWEDLVIPDGGSRTPVSESTFSGQRHLMHMKRGGTVFRYAVESMARLGKELLELYETNIEEIDWWIPHQANLRIIESTARLLKISPEKTLVTVDQYGNSSAATIPVTLDKAMRLDRKIHPGDLVLMTAAAAGMTSAAVLFRA